jgi:hypothetical protein
MPLVLLFLQQTHGLLFRHLTTVPMLLEIRLMLSLLSRVVVDPEIGENADTDLIKSSRFFLFLISFDIERIMLQINFTIYIMGILKN